MKKLTMHTPDITEGNIAKIAELFPNVVTEKEGADGVTIRAIDFDLLRQTLSGALVEDDSERYRLDWPGKKASLLKANTPITNTLRPDRESSVNFDTTENVFIEGDNFEVLKVLQESYLGKVKMIYIDPPYNTGHDFVYRDNRTVSKEDYEEELGVEDEEGGKLFRNTDTNGRFHSDWLSMMYERLVVARDLLKDDGVIFISIDDNEVTNLRKICGEVFGEENFISSFVWHNNVKGRQMDLHVKNTYESIVMYSKNLESLTVATQKDAIDVNSFEKDEISYYKKDYPLHNGTADFHINNRPNLAYSIYYNPITCDAKTIDEKIRDKENKLAVGPYSKEGQLLVDNGYVRIIPKYNTTYNNQRVWRWGAPKFLNEYKTELLFIEESGGYYIYQKKRFEDGVHEKTFKNYINIDGGSSKKELNDLLGGKLFDSPKPVSLIKTLLQIGSESEQIVLDFFAGSGTTAHAVVQLNAEDGGNRKFVMVQIPEETGEDSEAYKAGYKYISDISKERIRRAGKKILEENKEKLAERETPLDIGFRAYKADTTNMKDVYYHPFAVVQEDLFNLVSNIKEDRTPEDLLTQVILDLGLTLDLPIEKKELRGNSVYFVAGNALVACFDDKIDFGIVDDIAKCEPLKVVFKDASFKEEQDRTNVDTRFKRLSPDTIITVL